jgi:hypothetical protein
MLVQLGSVYVTGQKLVISVIAESLQTADTTEPSGQVLETV